MLMALTRHSPLGDQRRTFAMRAYYGTLGKVVDVYSCGFDSLDSEAEVAVLGTSISFRVPMRDLVLLEHTNREDSRGVPIYEGDRVRATAQNEYGSWEIMEGTVLFDEERWGFTIAFDVTWPRDLTGFMQNVEVVGTIFDDKHKDHALQSLSLQKKAVGNPQ